MPEPQSEKKEENEESTTQSQISDTDTDDTGDIFMYIMKEINDNKKHKKSSVSANDTQPSVSDEHINELIKAALEKWMEEQKPKDTVQENIQKGFEKVDCV